MNKPTLLRLWSAGFGGMDALTGLLLIVAPLPTLGLLGIHPAQGCAVFLSWIGAFVMSVGLGYGLVWIREGYGEPVWLFTALVRAVIAVFVGIHVACGLLEARWIPVGCIDAVVAVGQILMVRAGWWKEVVP